MIFLPVLINAQSGYDIALQMDARVEPADMWADLSMVLTNSRGKTRTSVLRTVSKDGGNRQMIWFLAPADDRGVAFLKIEHDDQDDEMRLWLPAFKKIRRISGGRKGDAFMGSDLSFEDMTNRPLNEYTYKLLGTELLAGENCYILEVTPRAEVRSAYSKHVTWVTQETLLPVKEESYDRVGNLLKRKSFSYARIKEYDTPAEITVVNVQKNHRTDLIFENVELDTGVSEDLFHERNLRRLP